MLSTLAARRQARDWARRTGGTGAAHAMRDYQQAATELALLHDRVARGAVEAWMVGEHGEGAVPLWSRVRVEGRPTEVPPDVREAVLAELRDWYVTHVALDSGRSSTWTSGHGLARMVDALVQGDDAPWPASVVLRGEYGLDGVAVSVPVSLGPGGVQTVHEWPLADEERAALHAIAGEIAAAAADL
jgi:malate dehydrogenase